MCNKGASIRGTALIGHGSIARTETLGRDTLSPNQSRRSQVGSLLPFSATFQEFPPGHVNVCFSLSQERKEHREKKSARRKRVASRSDGRMPQAISR
jgi:hypothetical protein